MAEAISYVVRDVTGETQLSIRFTLRSSARQFADQCAMPVRLWRIVSRRKAVPTKNLVCPECGAPWQPQNPTTCGPCGGYVENGPVTAEVYAAKKENAG